LQKIEWCKDKGHFLQNHPLKNQTFTFKETLRLNMLEQITETIQYITERTDFKPEVGIILGTGLSGLSDEIEQSFSFNYAEIPHFPVSTVQSHKGSLIFGLLHGVPVVAMAGRFHYYEGYSMQELTFPVRVLRHLGIRRLMISNAAGGVNPDYRAGDLVFIEDHINMMPDNPLRGKNDNRLGPRFPDMLHAYDKELNQKSAGISKEYAYQGTQGSICWLARTQS
jgi:purine-nucleoside phosphorylase